jgi:hypothetical protein
MPRFAMRLFLVSALLLLTAAAPATARTIVRYERSGGLAGLHDTLTVSSGGKVAVAGRSGTRHSTLSAKRLARLKDALAAARFKTLRARYAPPYIVSDGITETVRHAGRTVTVETGGDPPKRLRRLLARLANLL